MDALFEHSSQIFSPSLSKWREAFEAFLWNLTHPGFDPNTSEFDFGLPEPYALHRPEIIFASHHNALLAEFRKLSFPFFFERFQMISICLLFECIPFLCCRAGDLWGVWNRGERNWKRTFQKRGWLSFGRFRFWKKTGTQSVGIIDEAIAQEGMGNNRWKGPFPRTDSTRDSRAFTDFRPSTALATSSSSQATAPSTTFAYFDSLSESDDRLCHFQDRRYWSSFWSPFPDKRRATPALISPQYFFFQTRLSRDLFFQGAVSSNKDDGAPVFLRLGRQYLSEVLTFPSTFFHPNSNRSARAPISFGNTKRLHPYNKVSICLSLLCLDKVSMKKSMLKIRHTWKNRKNNPLFFSFQHQATIYASVVPLGSLSFSPSRLKDSHRYLTFLYAMGSLSRSPIRYKYFNPWYHFWPIFSPFSLSFQE